MKSYKKVVITKRKFGRYCLLFNYIISCLHFIFLSKYWRFDETYKYGKLL